MSKAKGMSKGNQGNGENYARNLIAKLNLFSFYELKLKYVETRGTKRHARKY